MKLHEHSIISWTDFRKWSCEPSKCFFAKLKDIVQVNCNFFPLRNSHCGFSEDWWACSEKQKDTLKSYYGYVVLVILAMSPLLTCSLELTATLRMANLPQELWTCNDTFQERVELVFLKNVYQLRNTLSDKLDSLGFSTQTMTSSSGTWEHLMLNHFVRRKTKLVILITPPGSISRYQYVHQFLPFNRKCNFSLPFQPKRRRCFFCWQFSWVFWTKQSSIQTEILGD